MTDHAMSDEPMTGAELRVVREHLGLTTRWLADDLHVAERSVHRWESGERPVPGGVWQRVEDLEAITADVISRAVQQLGDSSDDPAVFTYATDMDMDVAHREAPSPYPASWHRAMVARVAQEVPGLRIEWHPFPFMEAENIVRLVISNPA